MLVSSRTYLSLSLASAASLRVLNETYAQARGGTICQTDHKPTGQRHRTMLFFVMTQLLQVFCFHLINLLFWSQIVPHKTSPNNRTLSTMYCYTYKHELSGAVPRLVSCSIIVTLHFQASYRKTIVRKISVIHQMNPEGKNIAVFLLAQHYLFVLTASTLSVQRIYKNCSHHWCYTSTYHHGLQTVTVAALPCFINSCCSSSSVVCRLMCPSHNVVLHTVTHTHATIIYTILVGKPQLT